VGRREGPCHGGRERHAPGQGGSAKRRSNARQRSRRRRRARRFGDQGGRRSQVERGWCPRDWEGATAHSFRRHLVRLRRKNVRPRVLPPHRRSAACCLLGIWHPVSGIRCDYGPTPNSDPGINSVQPEALCHMGRMGVPHGDNRHDAATNVLCPPPLERRQRGLRVCCSVGRQGQEVGTAARGRGAGVLRGCGFPPTLKRWATGGHGLSVIKTDDRVSHP
jgi:hypothetical protein